MLSNEIFVKEIKRAIFEELIGSYFIETLRFEETVSKIVLQE